MFFCKFAVNLVSRPMENGKDKRETFSFIDKNNVVMKKFTSVLAALCISVGCMAGDISDSIIQKAPDGTVRHYYGSAQIVNPELQSLMTQIFTKVDLVFGDDGFVYMQTPLLTDYSSAYLKGKLSDDGKSVEFDNRQAIYKSPNEGVVYYVCKADEDLMAGTLDDNKFFDSKIVMKIEGDQSLNASTIIGVYADSVQYCYDFSYLPVIKDKETVDKGTKVYSLKYDYLDGSSKVHASSNAAVYEEDNNVYIKGFIPKYPEAWVLTKKIAGEDSLSISSAYVLQRSAYTGITFLYGKLGSTLLASTKLGYDSTTGVITSIAGENFAGYYIDLDYNLASGTNYTNLVFSPIEVATMATPANPQKLKYQEGSYKMMKFDVRSVDKDGNDLNTANLYYRIYINGNLYTFTKDVYNKLTENMTLIPYSFSNDGYPFDRSGSTVYVELQQISTPQTVGVQEVYVVDGHEQCSDILTYDVASKESMIISGISTVYGKSAKAVYYDLKGRCHQQPVKGINLVRQPDGSMKKVIVE